jgi:hypothetical protein
MEAGSPVRRPIVICMKYVEALNFRHRQGGRKKAV